MARTRRTRPEKVEEDVEVLDQQEESYGTEVGLLVCTTVFVLAAVILVCLCMKNQYGVGPFA